ncbi:hypothetical protein BJ170DRAFT_380955 [Xylariales sp. AK1849]|nr:hypothetical protein BJ170DRAFT_380955 [Xylariales sp. AK1849]
MQGDIFQLDFLLDTDKTKSTHISLPTTKTPYKTSTIPSVSIYNEDDLSHLLYQRSKPLDDAEIHEAFDHAHCLGAIAAAFDDYCSDVPHEYSDDSGLPSDDEEDEVSTPTLEDTVKRSSLASAPRFDLHTGLSNLESRRQEDARQIETQVQENDVEPEMRRVSTITGRLMSLWPLPTDLQEYEWSDEEEEDDGMDGVVPESQHVSRIEGACMSWWPLPVDIEKHEWNERFYE